MPIDSLLAPLLIAVCAAVAGWGVWRISPFYQRLVALDDSSPARYPMLDGLRGQLALAVFVCHAYGHFLEFRLGLLGDTNYTRTFLFLGDGAVAQFFLITGFLFWGKAIDQKIGPFIGDLSLAWWRVPLKTWGQRLHSALGHYYSRAWRIGPLFLLVTAVAMAFVLAQGGLTLHVTPLALLGQVSSFLLLGFLATVPVNGVDTSRFFGPAWTLRAEWRFYLLLPLLAIFATTRRFAAICIGVIVGSIILHLLGIDRPLVNNRHYAMFLVGMAAAHLVRHYPVLPLLRSAWISLLMIPAVALAIRVGEFSPWWFLLHGLIFVPVAYGNSFFGLLKTRAFRTLGIMSYSIYLLHGPIIQAFSTDLTYFGILNRMTPLQYWLAVGLLTFPLVALCAITYRFIEHPHLHKRLHKRSARATPAAPAVQTDSTVPATPNETISA